MISDLIKNLFSYLFPPSCVLCGSEDTAINICKSCTDKLILTREMRRPWLFSLYRYRTDPVATCIRHLKNFPDQDMINELLNQKKMMVEHWTAGIIKVFQCVEIVIIPVPIHRSRFVDRGYNQTDIIAHAYAKTISDKINETSLNQKNEKICISGCHLKRRSSCSKSLL